MRSQRTFVARRCGAVLALAAALVLAGCGSTEPATPSTPDGDEITVTDARGKQVTVDGPAERVVGLEWGAVEHLVSLDVMPVGVADVQGYTAWVTAAPLDDTVTDVGVRGEPSVDAIAALAPDLVVATTDLSDAAVAQLERFAPVLVQRPADAQDGIGQMRRNVAQLGTVTGTEEQAGRLLADFDTTLAEGADALSRAGLAGRPFAFADGWMEGNQVSVRPFVSGSLVSSVTQELGMKDAWTLDGDADYGLASTDVEGLTALPPDVVFLYITNDAEGPDPFRDGLWDNAIWTSLPFVQGGNVHRLPDGIWMFGGPASMTQYVDAVVRALTR